MKVGNKNFKKHFHNFKNKKNFFITLVTFYIPKLLFTHVKSAHNAILANTSFTGCPTKSVFSVILKIPVQKIVFGLNPYHLWA